jgi:phosphate:Na+ symporter
VTRDENLYAQLREKEHELDDMELRYRQHHFRRMADKECVSTVAASIYCDLLGTLERMGDHCTNVAKSSVTGLTSDLSDDEAVMA